MYYYSRVHISFWFILGVSEVHGPHRHKQFFAKNYGYAIM